MCYAPIRIKNNRKFYRPLVDQLYMTVPCGKCRECVSNARHDWFVRLYYEWKRFKLLGGSTFFITLTYNDDELPMYLVTHDEDVLVHDWWNFLFENNAVDYSVKKRIERYEDFWKDSYISTPSVFNSELSELKGFDKKSVQNFFKSLRQYLCKYKDGEIKYYLVCEYGEQLHRPHYHLLLFVPYQIDPSVLREYVELSWCRKVNALDVPQYIRAHALDVKKNTYQRFSTLGTRWRDWIIKRNSNNSVFYFHLRGFCNYAKDKNNPNVQRPFVDSVSSIEYVTKYFHKFDSYLNKDAYRKFYDYYKVLRASLLAYNQLRKDNVSLPPYRADEKLRKVIQSFGDFFPFTLNSNGIGVTLLQKISGMPHDSKLQYLAKESTPIIIDGDTQHYKVPTYILNRLFYYNENNPCYDKPLRMVSSLGVECIKLRYDLKIKNFIRSIESVDKVYIPLLQSNEKEQFQCAFGLSVEEYLQRYRTLMFGFTYRHLAMYSICFKDVSCGDLRSIYQGFSLDDFVTLSQDMFDYKVDTNNDMIESLLVVNSNARANTFNTLPIFYGLDLIIDAHNYIRNLVNTRANLYDDSKDKRCEQIKEAFKMLQYSYV